MTPAGEAQIWAHERWEYGWISAKMARTNGYIWTTPAGEVQKQPFERPKHGWKSTKPGENWWIDGWRQLEMYKDGRTEDGNMDREVQRR